MARWTKGAVAAGLLLLVAGCSSVYRNHGYVPVDEDLATLQVGVDTRDTVAQAIGTPTSAGLLGDGGWYYVQSRFRQFAYRAPEEIDREVVAISFTPAGTVENIERFGLREGRVVALSRRVTEANVKGVGFLSQLFGNIGNFEAGNFVD
ncbi:outer membrane protein assembly factor BamE [Profundibacterium mesophilum]|uniref:Outer membrane biogenesis protein BamE n=1 Tax=Profundibacterium mesophilum KAUST100406-0324 TaxID=1037889 RepID=A0A921NR66_9RHOB|nr:outer membrane protein assembly factor BamE [Profundibacterium mesophilum]KAF0677526.1 outer membrane biogenesis protein BamE [Profundibacterium mesophilum KAUST100406-0324]